MSENLSPPVCYAVPLSLSSLNLAMNVLKNILFFCMFPFILLGISCILLSRGVIFSQVHKKKFEFGLDVSDSGIEWDQPYREMFLYDRSRFHPSRILHVARGILKDGRTREFFRKHTYPFIDFYRIGIPVGFFLNRIFLDFLLLNTLRWFAQLPNLNKNQSVGLPALAAMKMTIEAEILYEQYDIRVFIARDDFNSFHIVRTIVANRMNCHTVGFSIGDYSIKSINYLFFDRYCIWGNFYNRFHEHAMKYSKTEVIGAGIFGLDKTFDLLQRGYTPVSYRDLAKKYRLIMIAGTSHSPDLFITKQSQLDFYKTVLDEVTRYPDTYCVIRPKSVHELDAPEFQNLFVKYDRIKIEKDIWAYRLLTICDIVICPGSTSIGMESLLAGKKVLYFDNTGWKRHIYAKYSPYLVAFSGTEFTRNLHRVLHEGQYLDKTVIDKIQSDHGFAFDGRVTARLKTVCRDLAREKPE
jgi:hypothetical protein